MWAIFLKSMGFKDIKYDIPVCQIHYKLTKRPVVPLNAIFAFIGFWRLLQSIMSTLRTMSALLTMHIVSFEIFWVKECKSVNYVKDCVPSFGIFYIKFVAVFRNPHLGTFWKFTDVVWDLYLGRLFSPARQITSQTAGPQLWTKHRSPSAFQSGEFCGIYETWGEPHWTFQNERMQPQIEGKSLIGCQVKIWSFLNCLSDCFNFGLESCFSTFNLTIC